MDFLKQAIAKRKEKRFVDTSNLDFSVHLKPIFRLSPSLYLRLLLTGLLLSAAFFLFLFPGILRNGSLVTFTSSPSHAAVYIDGNYAGATPFRRFLPRGNHQFSLHYTGAEANSRSQKTGGRIPFSLFFPKKATLHLTAANLHPEQTVDNTLLHFNRLSCFHSFETPTLPPPFVSYCTEQVLAHPDPAAVRTQLNRLFSHLLPLANTPELKKDCLQALFTAAAALLPRKTPPDADATAADVPTPPASAPDAAPNEAVLSAVSRYLIDQSLSNPSLFFSYYSFFTPEERHRIKATPHYRSYQQALIRYCSRPVNTDFGRPTGKSLVRGGHRFYEYTGGYLRQHDLLTTETIIKLSEDEIPTLIPTLYYLPDFYLSQTCVTGDEFAAFLAAHPRLPDQWKEASQINRYYSPSVGAAPVTGLSWFACNAYANACRMRLPYSFELAAAEFAPPPCFTPVDREWCAETALPACVTLNPAYPERLLQLKREKESQSPQTAAMPAEFCTEFASFRLAFSSSPLQLIPLELH